MDKNLATTIKHYEAKVDLFQRLRRTLRTAPEDGSEGLRETGVTHSFEELKAIRKDLEAFQHYLVRRISTQKNQQVAKDLKGLKKQIDQYYSMILPEPMEVNAAGQTRLIFLHRTNNIMERGFRSLHYSNRRITANISIRKSIINMHPSTPLVKNLKNKNYVKLVFQNEDFIARRFAEIDEREVRDQLKQKKKSPYFMSKKTRKLIRKSHFLGEISNAITYITGHTIN